MGVDGSLRSGSLRIVEDGSGWIGVEDGSGWIGVSWIVEDGSGWIGVSRSGNFMEPVSRTYAYTS